MMIGALATIELLEGKPFFFTFFVSNGIKLHPTDTSRYLDLNLPFFAGSDRSSCLPLSIHNCDERIEEFSVKHAGSLVFPPSSPKRVDELGPYESLEIDVEGGGWKRSQEDIVIAGI